MSGNLFNDPRKLPTKVDMLLNKETKPNQTILQRHLPRHVSSISDCLTIAWCSPFIYDFLLLTLELCLSAKMDQQLYQQLCIRYTLKIPEWYIVGNQALWNYPSIIVYTMSYNSSGYS